MRLGLEVDVFDHAAQLNHALELHLAPAPAHVRRPQRSHQLFGAVVEARGGAHHRLHLARQGGHVARAVLFQRVQVLVEAGHGVFQRDEVVCRRRGCLDLPAIPRQPAEDGSDGQPEE